MEVPDGPVVIGHIPLLDLDYVVDLESRSLIGNPAHGGERMYEIVLRASAKLKIDAPFATIWADCT